MKKALSKLLIIGLLIICLIPTNNVQAADTTITNMTDLSSDIATHIENREDSFTIHYEGDIAGMQAGFDSMFGSLLRLDPEVNLYISDVTYDMRYTSTYADITMHMTYFYTKADETYVDNQVVTILGKIITPAMSDFEKEEAINNWIYNNVTYDKALKKNTAYDALVSGDTVCTGYAMLAHTMLTAVGIKSQYITGTLAGTNHIWLMVCVDGNWYQFDPTNDSKENGLYYFFNQTDAFLKSSQFVWDATLYPAATTTYTLAEKAKDRSIDLARGNVPIINPQPTNQSTSSPSTSSPSTSNPSTSSPSTSSPNTNNSTQNNNTRNNNTKNNNSKNSNTKSKNTRSNNTRSSNTRTNNTPVNNTKVHNIINNNPIISTPIISTPVDNTINSTPVNNIQINSLPENNILTSITKGTSIILMGIMNIIWLMTRVFSFV